jgi:two-component system, NtrC family, response regulator PilR
VGDLNVSQASVLIIDDEPDILELLRMTLSRMDLAVATAGDLAAARSMLEETDFDLCLTDMHLPDGDGLDLVGWLQHHRPQLPVAVITAHGNVEAAVTALKRGAFDFVSKPVELEALRTLVRTALKLRKAEDGDASAQLLGSSAAMASVRDLVARVARSQAPVHISGESGTGKELVARMIHEQGPRIDGPFVPVNCGAIPAELMESEFFGHTKGAFTGAHQDRSGLFQTADGGTLFLDEVADLPLHMQVKLLRVIQEKSVRPVGTSEEQKIDVRILSATHRDLAQQVSDGAFRQDLFYRIQVIEVAVPPLRERIEDVAVLAERILARLADDHDRPLAALSEGALARLHGHPFPGNVRELENVLERAFTLCEGDAIGSEDLTLRDEATRDPDEDHNTDDLPGMLDEVERSRIQGALESHRHNKTKTAESLGLSLRQLRYRIKKLGLK